MKYYQQESKLAVQSGDVRGRVQLLANIGNEYSTQRNYEAGMRYLREGVQRGGASAGCPAIGSLLPVLPEHTELATWHRLYGAAHCGARKQPAWVTPALAETTSVALDYLARTYLEAYHDTARADAYARKAQQLSLPNSYGWVVALAVQGKVRVLEKRWPQARAVLLAARAGALTDHEIARLASV